MRINPLCRTRLVIDFRHWAEVGGVASPVGQRNIFRFGLFEADPASGELIRAGERVRLQDQPFRMLMLLLERPGDVVTRDELREKLWAENTFVEFNNGLNVAVKKIRDALGDDADNPRFVETVPRRGYRFIAPVSVAMPQSPSAVEQSVLISKSATPVEPTSVPPWRERRYLVLAALLAVVTIVAFLITRRISVSTTTMQGTTPLPRVEVSPHRAVAVMEFQNVSGHPETKWLSTAIPEMLSTELAAGDKLRLIPGEDVARVKRELHLEDSGSLAKDTAAGVGRDLRVDVLVVGSYTAMESAGSRRLRLDLRLQDARNGEIVAELAQTGTEEKLFELVSRAGKGLRERLGIAEISPNEEASVIASVPTTPEAMRLYAEGLARLRRLEAASARDLLKQAVTAEPAFPLSHMALASTWRLLGYDQKARAEAKKALDLASKLPRADRLLIEGRYHEMSGEVDQAVAAYRALFALTPDSLENGLLLAALSKPTEARATLDALRRLPEPLSNDPRIDMQQARLEDDGHQYLAFVRRAADKAKQQGAFLLEARARSQECNTLNMLGQLEEAGAVCESALRIFTEAGSPFDTARTLRFLGDVRAHQGRFGEAIQLHRQALKSDRASGSDGGSAVGFNQLATDYEAQGDTREAEKLYRHAYALFVKVGNQYNASVLASNVGGSLLSQGKLADAETWFEQSLGLARVTGFKSAEDPALENLAELAFLRGDLHAAHEQMEAQIARRRESVVSSGLVEALNHFSELLLAQADFAGARQKATEALTIADKEGAKYEAAQSRLVLAVLDVEEGHALQAEPVIRDALAFFHSERMRDDELQALLALVRCLLEQSKAADAGKALEQAREISSRSQDPADRLRFAIAAGREVTNSTDGRSRRSYQEVQSSLRNSISTAHSLGYGLLEYEARLALGEMLTKNSSAGRQYLSSLQREAHAHGFELIARKAAKLL